MKVTFTLLSLMAAFVFVFALVNPGYAGEKEKEFKIEQMENKKVEKAEPFKNKSEEEKVFFVDDDFFFVDDDFFFPEERFFFRPKAFFGPRFFGAPRFFDD